MPRKSRTDLTAEELRNILDYDPETGEFRWRITHGKVRAEDIAGTLKNNGYYQIHINYRLYLSHRLAWLYVHGYWPLDEIDHIDRNPSNNKISNLRPATSSQNQANMHSKRMLGKGIKLAYNKYQARIKKDGKEIHLGTFNNLEDARNAYASAAKQHFGEYARI